MTGRPAHPDSPDATAAGSAEGETAHAPATTITKPGGLNLWQVAAYASPAIPLAALTLPVYIFVPTFYAQSLGLGLGAVGLVLLIARIWDVVTDPLIGWLSDRTPARFGRRRIWIIAGAPLVIAGTWTLFRPPDGAGAAHLLGWSLVLYLGWTMMVLPLTAWGAELSRDYDERSRIAGFREGFIVTGTLVALGIPFAMGLGEAGREGEALAVLAIMVAVLLPLTLGLMLAGVREPPPISTLTVPWRRGLRIMRDNAPFRRLIAAYLLNGIANGLPATMFLLFVEHRLGIPDRSGVLLFTYFLCGVLAVPVWLRLSYRFEKHKVWGVAMLGACFVFVTVPLIGPGSFVLFLVVCILTGFALGADLTLPSSMQADVVDEDTARSGAQRTGLYFALWGMATKLALALAVGIAFPLLDLAGFQGDGRDSTAALFTLAALYALVPVGFKLAAIWLMWGYPITRARQLETRHRIDADRLSAT